MPQFKITLPDLPGAAFLSREALLANLPRAERYQRAVAVYKKTGDQLPFVGALQRLGVRRAADILWHLERPGVSRRTVYA